MLVTFLQNGAPSTAELAPLAPIGPLLRERGVLDDVCSGAGCRGCRVLLDGTVVHACRVPALRLLGAVVMGADQVKAGRAAKGLLSRHAGRPGPCARCLPGHALLAESILGADAAPSRALRRALEESLRCRCTGLAKGPRRRSPVRSRRSEPSALIPETVDEALTAMAAQRWTLLSGEETLPVSPRGSRPPRRIASLHRLAPELRYASVGPEALRLGALTRLGELQGSVGISRLVPLLKEALELREEALLTTAEPLWPLLLSPTDGIAAALLALDAVAVLQGPKGVRRVPLEDRSLARRSDELVVELWARTPHRRASQRLVSGAPEHPGVWLAAVGPSTRGALHDLRLGCAAGSIRLRLHGAEEALEGRRATPENISLAVTASWPELQAAGFRREVTKSIEWLLSRALR